MQLRGRRVVLLIAGALPLLAEYDSGSFSSNSVKEAFQSLGLWSSTSSSSDVDDIQRNENEKKIRKVKGEEDDLVQQNNLIQIGGGGQGGGQNNNDLQFSLRYAVPEFFGDNPFLILPELSKFEEFPVENPDSQQLKFNGYCPWNASRRKPVPSGMSPQPSESPLSSNQFKIQHQEQFNQKNVIESNKEVNTTTLSVSEISLNSKESDDINQTLVGGFEVKTGYKQNHKINNKLATAATNTSVDILEYEESSKSRKQSTENKLDKEYTNGTHVGTGAQDSPDLISESAERDSINLKTGDDCLKSSKHDGPAEENHANDKNHDEELNKEGEETKVSEDCTINTCEHKSGSNKNSTASEETSTTMGSDSKQDSQYKSEDTTTKNQNESEEIKPSDDELKEGNSTAVDEEPVIIEESEAEATKEVTENMTTQESEDISNMTQETVGTEKDQVPEMDKVVVDYASKSAGALILDKSKGFKGTSNLLNSDKDKYAIAPCENKKSVVISLSEDIMVKQVKLANYERYSSSPKEFQLLGSQTIDGGWVDLGTYTATMAKGVQIFDLIEPSWVRYLQFRFLKHYGDEHYCTITQIMVHGNTMLQGFHEQWKETEEETQKILEQVEAVNTTSSTDDDAVSVSDEQNSRNVAVDSGDIKEADEGNSRDSSNLSDSEASLKREDKGSIGGESELAAPDTGEKDIVPTESPVALKANSDNSNKTGGRCDKEPSCEKGIEDKNPANETSSGSVLASASISLSSIKSVKSFLNSRPPSSANKAPVSTLSSRSLASERLASIQTSKKFSEPLIDMRMIDKVQSLLRTGNKANPSLPELGERISSFLSNFDAERGNTTIHGISEIAVVKKIQAMIRNTSVDSTFPDLTERITSFLAENISVSANETVLESNKKIDQSVNTTGSNISNSDQTESKPPTDEQHLKSLGIENLESLYNSSMVLAKLLDQVPSVDCLKALNYTEFKAKIVAAKGTKGASGSGGNANPGNAREPIFKKLTDEIKSLQISLSVHDQFTKEAVACYQQVLFDLVIELEVLKRNHEVRLTKLEELHNALPAQSILAASQALWWFVNLMKFIVTFLYNSLVHLWENFMLDDELHWNNLALVIYTILCLYVVPCVIHVAVLSFQAFMKSKKGNVKKSSDCNSEGKDLDTPEMQVTNSNDDQTLSVSKSAVEPLKQIERRPDLCNSKLNEASVIPGENKTEHNSIDAVSPSEPCPDEAASAIDLNDKMIKSSSCSDSSTHQNVLSHAKNDRKKGEFLEDFVESSCNVKAGIGEEVSNGGIVSKGSIDHSSEIDETRYSMETSAQTSECPTNGGTVVRGSEQQIGHTKDEGMVQVINSEDLDSSSKKESLSCKDNEERGKVEWSPLNQNSTCSKAVLGSFPTKGDLVQSGLSV